MAANAAAPYIAGAAFCRIGIARSGSAMSETRNDVCGYNIRNELISADKLVGRDAPIAPQSPASTVEYAYQYDDIGNRIASFDLGTNRTYTANNLNQYFEISTSDAGLQTSGFEPQYDDDGNQTMIQTTPLSPPRQNAFPECSTAYCTFPAGAFCACAEKRARGRLPPQNQRAASRRKDSWKQSY